MHRPTSLLSALSLLLLPLACSGGSSGASDTTPPTGADMQLVFDTAAGTDARVTANLDAVTFENVDGTVVGDLADGPATVVLTDPDGEFSAISLTAPPSGTYQAVHLVFAPGTARARFADGSERPLDLAHANVRVPLDQMRRIPDTDAGIVLVRTRGLALDGRGSGRIPVDPDFTGDTTDVVPVREVRADVIAVDLAARSFMAELATVDRPIVEAVFADPVLLLRDDQRISVDAFLGGLAAGSIVQVVDGELRADMNGSRTLTVFAAIDLGTEDPNGNGRKSEVHGCIAAIDAATETFTLSPYVVDKGEHNLPAPLPGSLGIDAGDARIKWVPRLGRHTGHLPFSALAVGMRVEVEWLGPAPGAVPAMKVDIRAESASPLRSLSGVVTGIAVPSDELTIDLATPITVDGTTFSAVRLRLAPDTIVVGGDATQPPIQRFAAGDQVEALARWQQGDVFVADYVRLVE